MAEKNVMVINGSVIEISKLCMRIYLTNFFGYKVKETLIELDKIAKEQNLTKIIARIPVNYKEDFLNNGYILEAHIPKFYNNRIDAYFMGKFLTPERKICHDKEIIENVLEVSVQKPISSVDNLPEGFCCKKIEELDIVDLAELYKSIFETYPSPIFDTNYIAKTIHNSEEYLGIWKDGKLIATAATEKDFEAQSAELVAFAVIPEYRGYNLPLYLIKELEKILKEQKFKTVYAIARAISYGMNISFAKMNYIYAGTLINNTCISGNLEHMHVWYKKL